MKPFVWIGLPMIFLAACAAVTPPSSPALETAQIPTTLPSTILAKTLTPTVKPSTQVAAASPRSTPFPSPSPDIIPSISSPLEGIPISDLPTIAANPFVAPRPGYDDGHHGVDFAFYHYKDLAGIEGVGVQAVFSGKVAAVIADRPPYGNMIILETPLEALPAGVVASLTPLELITPAPPDPRLTCPAQTSEQLRTGPPWSLYLLYAHMQAIPPFHTGETVASGQKLGNAGNTGMSGNPHLHLEARLGPSNSTFTSLSHYNNSATLEEIANYCTWRVSGEFRLIDPLEIVK